MGEVIQVNFKTGKKVEKYTILKNVCVVCFNDVVYDSRKERNEPYIEISKTKGQCVCKSCAISIKEVVDENEWDK